MKVLQEAEGPKNSDMALELFNYLTWAKHFSSEANDYLFIHKLNKFQ